MLKYLTLMDDKTKTCEMCDRVLKDCICGPDCSHICDLDYGEYYCPICFPNKNKSDDE